MLEYADKSNGHVLVLQSKIYHFNVREATVLVRHIIFVINHINSLLMQVRDTTCGLFRHICCEAHYNRSLLTQVRETACVCFVVYAAEAFYVTK